MTDKEFYIQNKPAWRAPVFYCERKTLEDAREEKIKRGPSSSSFHVFPSRGPFNPAQAATQVIKNLI